MRCQCCNVILTPFEATIKKVSDNSFLDMCEKCFSYVADEVKVLTREDLREEVGIDVANYLDTEDNKDNYE
jgi:hypothetical protein